VLPLNRCKICLSSYSKNKRPTGQLRRAALAIAMNTGRALDYKQAAANALRSINGKRDPRFYQRGKRPCFASASRESPGSPGESSVVIGYTEALLSKNQTPSWPLV